MKILMVRILYFRVYHLGRYTIVHNGKAILHHHERQPSFLPTILPAAPRGRVFSDQVEQL